MFFDDISVGISRFTGRTLQNNRPWCWGVLVTYDQATHTAKVLLQPDRRMTGSLRLPTLDVDHCVPPKSGMQCLVAMNNGIEEAIIGLYHSDADAPPDTPGMALPSLYVGGAATVGALVYLPVLALPAASASWRGTQLMLAAAPSGAAGTADTIYVCLQSATGTFSWKVIATG